VSRGGAGAGTACEADVAARLDGDSRTRESEGVTPKALCCALVAAVACGVVSGCAPPKQKTPEPECTVDTRSVECWWVLYGCMPELSPRDACLAICRDQERGQLKICEGRLPHRPEPLMMSVRHLTCDRCIRFSDKPLGKR